MIETPSRWLPEMTLRSSAVSPADPVVGRGKTAGVRPRNDHAVKRVAQVHARVPLAMDIRADVIAQHQVSDLGGTDNGNAVPARCRR